MTFNHKRDRIQIIAEILGICKAPQTQTFIRHQTHLSYTILQNCLIQLLGRELLLQIQIEGQQKFFITPKGQLFLCKWLELQTLTGIEAKQKLAAIIPPKIQVTSKRLAN